MRLWTLSLPFVVILSGCTGIFKSVARYDEPTAEALAQLYFKTDDFIEILMDSLGSPSTGYEPSKPFYKSVDRDLRRLEFRVGSIPNNETSLQLVENIRGVVLGEGTCTDSSSSLRDFHVCEAVEGDSLTLKDLDVNRRNIRQTILAAIVYERSKRKLKQTEVPWK